MENEKKNKYDFLLYLLEKGDAMVCLDARHPNVDVPQSHKSNPSLNLVFNLNFRRPVDVNAEGIFSKLLFQGKPHQCSIPFEAVWAIFVPTFQEGQVWEESMPQDVDLTTQMIQNNPTKAKMKTVLGKSDRNSSDKAAPSKKDRSHLRVIK